MSLIHTYGELEWWVPAPGQKFAVRQDARRHGGKLNIFDYFTAPTSGPRPHRNVGFDTTYIITEGEAQFQVDRKSFTVRAGATVFVRRGRLHRWTNPDRFVCRMTIIQSPGQAKDFLRHGQVEVRFADREGCWLRPYGVDNPPPRHWSDVLLIWWGRVSRRSRHLPSASHQFGIRG